MIDEYLIFKNKQNRTKLMETYYIFDSNLKIRIYEKGFMVFSVK